MSPTKNGDELRTQMLQKAVPTPLVAPAHKTKDRATRIPLKTVCYGRVNGSCSTRNTVVIKYASALRKDGGVFPTYKSDCHNIREIYCYLSYIKPLLKQYSNVSIYMLDLSLTDLFNGRDFIK
jgi:hypothetical protein